MGKNFPQTSLNFRNTGTKILIATIGSGKTVSHSKILIVAFFVFFLAEGCSGSAGSEDSKYSAERKRMVARDLLKKDIRDPSVLAAMEQVPRHLFVDPVYRSFAYADRPLPINQTQSIPQAYIVALMVQSAQLTPKHHVLEIGSRTGYQTAILSRIAGQVYSVENKPGLAFSASQLLRNLDYVNVHIKQGDESLGWAEFAPYDAILVTDPIADPPQAWIDQLKLGGRMVLSLENTHGIQRVTVLTKTEQGLDKNVIAGKAFISITGVEPREEGVVP
ncbi:MAG: protein-L-isoaspartate O-methyltransferase [Nitrospinae bacterium CG11_big_fil_rev_8_21_14_0_20_45_15]|nr:MAG: protein-L-isoaspartate O-methyltransferase [Nitrospinae bacterium CG11_big_fil_rev_8_21_14_0_20_45_15]